eukprot:CAMPEP_0167799584 /NCGR_PEP_ID=MMETSP0111_2-20121227/17129_1 /TAXON_ID=91324 /ORGANISM="Lotharella globosa, Strain CCCM811" /LENGTH=174 /DNA_ID=CAMNT_0007694493 /DNA_START=98 /DNA_END=620 /DNA_ORIENTATION=-
MKCELEGLAKLNLKETTRLNVKARFSNGETHDNLWIDRKEEVDVPGGKGTANLLVKPPGGGKKPASYDDMKKPQEILLSNRLTDDIPRIKIESKGYPEYKAGDGWKTFAVLDCRGLEVTHWIVHHDGFTAETPGGETVDDIEFEDGEYYGYDEKAESETSIKSIETRVVLSKGG